MDDKLKVKISTIVRTLMLALALLNQILVVNGKQILPIQEEHLYTIISTSATIILSVWSWWKNNSFTKTAIKADFYLNNMRN